MATLSVLLTGCMHGNDARFRPREMELWYWHHTYLTNSQAVDDSKRLIERAARAGYTGLVLWDSSWTFLSQPNWPEENLNRVKEVIAFAGAKGLRVMPTVALYGHSNDVLKRNPNWAEGQRVTGSRFQVDAAGTKLQPVPNLRQELNIAPQPQLRVKAEVTPWHQYHVHLAVRTAGFQGLAQLEVSDGRASRLDANLHPASTAGPVPLDYVFNSAGSDAVTITAGAFGPYGGQIEISQFEVEETALVYVLRREGTPLRVYDPDAPDQVFTEGRDFDVVRDHKFPNNPNFDNDNFHDPGTVTIPAGSALRPGQEVAMDYYSVVPVYDEAVSVCLTHRGVMEWMIGNARDAASLLPPRSGLLLGHDEIRQMNSCALCRAQNLSAGALLAKHFLALSGELLPMGPLYVWSDMFDPGHNAHANFYQVEGDLARSWMGLPREVTVMNWNLDHLHNSLLWFSGDDRRQPVAHAQIIAGFYDPPDHDGAHAARMEWGAARGIPGVIGAMYTTWTNDYSQLEAFGRTSRDEWSKYRDARPW